jgi:hypothetical protein
LRRICDDEPRDVREHNPSVPQWLCEILEKLLAKSPGERFQSADEVADLLGRWLAHVQQPLVVPAPAAISRRAREQASARAGKSGRSATRLITAVLLVMAMLYGAWRGREFFAGRSTSDADNQQNSEQQQTDEPRNSPSVTMSTAPGLKPDAIQPELDRAWQATFRAEARLPGKPVEQRYHGTEEIHWLDGQLERLELELHK